MTMMNEAFVYEDVDAFQVQVEVVKSHPGGMPEDMVLGDVVVNGPADFAVTMTVPLADPQRLSPGVYEVELVNIPVVVQVSEEELATVQRQQAVLIHVRDLPKQVTVDGA